MAISQTAFGKRPALIRVSTKTPSEGVDTVDEDLREPRVAGLNLNQGL